MNLREKILNNCEVHPNPRFVAPCLLWRGGCLKTGYGRIFENREAYIVHRVVLNVPRGVKLRHICEHKHCCEETHITAASPSDIQKRRVRKHAGVSRKEGQWVAMIRPAVGMRRVILGRWATKNEARAAYDVACVALDRLPENSIRDRDFDYRAHAVADVERVLAVLDDHRNYRPILAQHEPSEEHVLDIYRRTRNVISTADICHASVEHVMRIVLTS